MGFEFLDLLISVLKANWFLQGNFHSELRNKTRGIKKKSPTIFDLFYVFIK